MSMMKMEYCFMVRGMNKVFGAVLVLAASGMLGFMKGREYKERICSLKVLEHIFEELLSDIRFGKINMSESFGRIANTVPFPYSRFLKNLCGELKWKRGRSFTEIFNEEVKLCLNNTSLEKEDLDKLLELGKAMDGVERETQIHVTEQYLRELNKQRNGLEETALEKQKVSQMLGVSGGVFLLILLL